MKEGVYPTDMLIVLLTGEQATSLLDLIFNRNIKSNCTGVEGGLFDFIYEKPISDIDIKLLLKTSGILIWQSIYIALPITNIPYQ